MEFVAITSQKVGARARRQRSGRGCGIDNDLPLRPVGGIVEAVSDVQGTAEFDQSEHQDYEGQGDQREFDRRRPSDICQKSAHMCHRTWTRLLRFNVTAGSRNPENSRVPVRL